MIDHISEATHRWRQTEINEDRDEETQEWMSTAVNLYRSELILGWLTTEISDDRCYIVNCTWSLWVVVVIWCRGVTNDGGDPSWYNGQSSYLQGRPRSGSNQVIMTAFWMNECGDAYEYVQRWTNTYMDIEMDIHREEITPIEVNEQRDIWTQGWFNSDVEK